jgi:hypothetical protein
LKISQNTIFWFAPSVLQLAVMLQQVAKYIYQGPYIVLKNDGAAWGKDGNAALNGITALTECDVAYVPIQV